MSNFEQDQQPGPPAIPVEGETEPRLLTRPAPEDSPAKPGTPPPDDRRWRRPGRREVPVVPNPLSWPDLRRWVTSLLANRHRSTPGRVGGGGRLHLRRAPRWVLGWLLGSLLLLLLVGAGWVLSLRHAAGKALPALDGDVLVPGLHSAAVVTRDRQGVPSITAFGLHDLLFAQGYTTAGDRLWQMDALRRHGAGELAEILGPSLIAHDQRQRILQMRAAADRALDHLPTEQRAQLQAYADGVNSYIESHSGSLPLEFHLLAYKPAPWTPRDSLLILLVMFQDLSTRFPQKLDREVLSAHLPPDLLPDLYPVGSWRDSPPAAQNHNISAPHPVELIPLDPSQARALPPASHTRPEDLLAASEMLGSPGDCPECRAGSNNWAVSGQRTASGKPLLANDTHLHLGIPDIWYEVGLHTAEAPGMTDVSAPAPAPLAEPAAAPTSAPVAGPTATANPLDVVGFSLPGLPFVVIGRNAGVAWGVTNLGADTQEVRVEHVRGAEAATEFERHDGTWAPVGHHVERIRVRGGRDRTVDVRFTTHAVGTGTMETPIISPLVRTEGRALSLAWTAYDPAALALPLLAANTAADGQALVAAFATFGGPTLNLVWADTSGHIGYHAIGFVPVRGSAVPRPRALPEAVPNPAVPAGPPVSDEDEGGEAAMDPPGAWPDEAARPHLLLSAYARPRQRRAGGMRRRGAHRRRRGETSPAEMPVAPASPVNPAVPAESPGPETAHRNYTIGSPSSPVPVDALDAGMEWSGYIAYGDLPAVTDPAGGVLATANSRITPDDYPWAVTDDWADPFRTERIVHLLSGRTGLTAADTLRMQSDVHSDVDQAMGQRLAYALDHASAQAMGKDARRLHQAADILRVWDGQLNTDSSGAALLTAVREALWPALLVPQLVLTAKNEAEHDRNRQPVDATQAEKLVALYTWGERTTALELLLQNQPVRWLPPNFGNWNDFLASVIERALQASHAPADLSQWRYGQRHTVEIAHPIFGDHRLLAHLLGVTATTGPQPAPGDATTIDAIRGDFGPSERFVADLASAEADLGNVTTGESGQERSPWYLDQFRPWLAGRSFALPGFGSAGGHVLRMLPAGGGV